MKRLIFLGSILFSLLGMLSCDFGKKENVSSSEDSVAVKIDDERNAELWAYLYSHEFVAYDTLSLKFMGDKAYINDVRVADALTVSENEEISAALIGVGVPSRKIVKLAVIREDLNRMVIDLSDPENVVFYVEKELDDVLEEEDSLAVK